MDALKAAKFDIANEAERQPLATAIMACLASADPTVRDGIAYEALTHMLRERKLKDDTKRALLVDLTARLRAPEGLGFEQPFAALALSEVARSDRVEAFLSEDELIKLLVDAQHWFINVSDYRGFVAHGADLLMQLALNPRIDAEGLRVIVSGVGVQVAPKGHAYVFGESERLARPVLFAAARGALDEAEWTEWLRVMATPGRGGSVASGNASRSRSCQTRPVMTPAGGRGAIKRAVAWLSGAQNNPRVTATIMAMMAMTPLVRRRGSLGRSFKW